MEAEPGQEWQTTLRLINSNPFPLKIRAQLRDFIPGPDGGTPQFLVPEENATATFANWIETEEFLEVPAEQTYELPITVRVPDNAQPGGHFAAILVSTESEASAGTGVGTTQAISSLLFLRVAGEISEVATIRSFRTTDYIVANPEATLELRIENRGNVHVQPQGEVVIYNMWGQERGIVPINKNSLFGNVLPDSVRTFRYTWSGEWSLADIGRYTAEAALTYGSNGKKTIFEQTTFWFIPFQWVAALTVFIIGFVLLLRWAIRAYIKRMFALAGIEPDRLSSIADTRADTTSDVTRSRKVSMVAPLEAGILDLRSDLQSASSREESRLVVIARFIARYRTFFIAALAITAAAGLIGWFIVTALDDQRDFVITTDNGTQTTAAEARALRNPVNTDAIEPPDGKYLTLVNQSGDPSITTRVERLLSGTDQLVTATEFDANVVEDRTVIVYPVSETERALALSKILNEAPISALSEDETRSTEIIVYIGSDAINW